MKSYINTLSLCLSIVVWSVYLSACSNGVEPNKLTIYKAKNIISLSEESGNAVVLKNDRILEVGQFEKVKEKYASYSHVVNLEYESATFVPGLINQHEHPWLAAVTMDSHIISIEEWNLPSGTYPRATSESTYRALLTKYVTDHGTPDELFLSWGYHQLWHGPIDREVLDSISETVPIAIFHRSTHEFIFNSKALQMLGVDETFIEKLSEPQKKQANLPQGHFWETGLMALAPKLFSDLIEPEKFINALHMIQHYWHQSGSTAAIEPGGLVNRNITIMQNAVFGQQDAPISMNYIVDGKTMALEHMETLLESTEEIQTWSEGKSRYLPKRIKLFTDGAVFSQLMQMSEGYLDGHHGEWIMKPALFKEAFGKYWDAGYQIHIHQNGDAALDLVLDTLDENLKRNPRENHRTVIVHFSNSRPDQIKRIKKLGAIVSVNPYYPVALTEKYSAVGLGAMRAHNMARLGELQRAGISYSLHADMPIAPASPLYLIWCAVNRVTLEGNLFAPSQRISVEQALRAVTIDAAFSVGLENEIGTIEKGKLANITVLNENLLEVDPDRIKDIEVLATINEGRVHPTESKEIPSIGLWDLIAVYWELVWARFNK